MSPHSFSESLARSQAFSDDPLWEDVYRQVFPDMVALVDHRGSGYWQALGIDRSIVLASSKQILVDEKVRWPNPGTGEVYEDILLEYESDSERDRPGWVEKPLLADYIAYCISGLSRVYFLPVIPLQRAWRAHKEAWLAGYGIREARNEEGGRAWTTKGCPVPVEVLFEALRESLSVEYIPSPPVGELVVAVDSREQLPYEFEGARTVTLRTGDYSVLGIEDKVAIERKRPEELYACAGRDRERFIHELERLATHQYAAIVVEGTLADLLSSNWSAVSHRAVINSLVAWSIRYGVHVWLAGDRALAQALTLRLLEKFHQERGIGKAPRP